jgi:hypothetical protein
MFHDSIDIDPVFDEKFHDSHMPAGRRGHEGQSK